jgi:hypothetical protein
MWSGSAWVAINTYTNTPRIVVAGSAKGSTPSLVRGGGYPVGSKIAYLAGDFPRGRKPAFSDGFRDGYSAKIAWMRGAAPSIPAFTFGKSGIKVAVIPFEARTSAGTTDLTSTKLAGTIPKLAFFFGIGATAYDSVTANARIFFGAADGVNQASHGCCLMDLGVNNNRC